MGMKYISNKFKDPIVGIIGGTGKMGSWFANISEKAGLKVYKVGRKSQMRPEEVALKCDIVVVSVPISVTYEIIKKIGPLISEDALFMDLTSIKKMPLDAMLKYSKAGVVGLHPLFGIDVDPELSKKVVICPGRGQDGIDWVVNLLKNEGLELVFLEPDEHDKLMGLIQGVNHFETISLAMKIRQSGIHLDKLIQASTQTFIKKINRIKNMFTQSPELFASLLMDNDWAIKCIESYLDAAYKLKSIIKTKDKEAFENLFRSVANFLEIGGNNNERDMG